MKPRPGEPVSQEAFHAKGKMETGEGPWKRFLLRTNGLEDHNIKKYVGILNKL